MQNYDKLLIQVLVLSLLLCSLTVYRKPLFLRTLYHNSERRKWNMFLCVLSIKCVPPIQKKRQCISKGTCSNTIHCLLQNQKNANHYSIVPRIQTLLFQHVIIEWRDILWHHRHRSNEHHYATAVQTYTVTITLRYALLLSAIHGTCKQRSRQARLTAPRVSTAIGSRDYTL